MNTDLSSDIFHRVGNLEQTTSGLESRVSNLEVVSHRLESVAQNLREDVAEIKGLMPAIATKSDMSAISERLSAKIDSAVIGVINQALSTYPAKAGVWWTAVGAVAMVVAAAITVLQVTGH